MKAKKVIFQCRGCPRKAEFDECYSCNPVWAVRYRRWSANKKVFWCSRCVSMRAGWWLAVDEEAVKAEKNNWVCKACRDKANDAGEVPPNAYDAQRWEYCTGGIDGAPVEPEREQANVFCKKCERQAPWTGNCTQHCEHAWLARCHGWLKGTKNKLYCPVCLEQDGYPQVTCSDTDKETKICVMCQGEEWH